MKISAVIPYRQRAANLRIALESLAAQSMAADDFEVVVGAMEYSQEYVQLCREFTDRLNIISVLSAQEFQIPRARNLATRQASGEVVLQLDADSVLPPDALRKLYDGSFADGQDDCVAGQVIGYDFDDVDDAPVVNRPYEHYLDVFAKLRDADKPGDPRFGVEPVLPWALAWTGYIAIRATTLREHDLYFDEGFRGWGVDDTEWGYRVWRSGTGIVLREDLVSIHMPHARDSKGNLRSEKTNLRHFLGKWPTVEVELAAALGAFEANDAYRDFRRVATTAVGEGNSFSAIAGEADGERHLVLGAVVDERRNIVDAGHAELVGRLSDVERNPLVGLALPYEDRVVDVCHVLPSIFALGEDYAAMVVAEATRVSHTVVKPSS